MPQFSSKKASEVRRCAVYGRVSVEDAAQTEHGSLEQQGHMGREMAKQLTLSTGIPHRVTVMLIEERGVSGGTTKRPKYQQLLQLIQSGKIDAVIAKEISRLNRSTADFCQFMKECERHGVSVHIKGLDVDPKSPMGRAMFQILAVVAELERELGCERTRSGILSAMINNLKIPGGRAVLGFDIDPEKPGFWTINEIETKQVQYIFETFNELLGYPSTIRKLTAMGIRMKTGSNFNKDSLKRVLQNQKYVGRMPVPGTDQVVPTPFKAIIASDVFETAQRNIATLEKDLSRRMRNGKRVFVLANLLECEDGSKFKTDGGTGRSKSYYYYRNKQHGISLRSEAVEQAVLESLNFYRDDKELLRRFSEAQKQIDSHNQFLNSQIVSLERRLSQLQAKEAKLTDELLNKPGSAELTEWINTQVAALLREREKVAEQLSLVTAERDHSAEHKLTSGSLRRRLERIFERLPKAEPVALRAMCQQLIKKL